jgi:hypothetical protein
VKGLKKQTSSGFECDIKNSRALRAKRRGVANWIPAPQKSGRIRSRRFVNGRSLIKFDLLVERFDVCDGIFIPCFSKPRKKRSETTAFFAPQVLAHNVLLQS